VGSFEPGFVYIGDDRHIAARYCQGRLIEEPK
jgi:hypothetical protein